MAGKTQINFQDWRVSHKYIRIEHNKAVNIFFRNNELSKTKINLQNSILIYKKDSAIVCQAKMQFFEQYIREYENVTPVLPEWWQLRKGSEVPQLVVTFRPTTINKNNRSSCWSLSFPHFLNSPEKTKHIGGYEKGSIQGLFTFKDNSKIIIYGVSPERT